MPVEAIVAALLAAPPGTPDPVDAAPQTSALEAPPPAPTAPPSAPMQVAPPPAGTELPAVSTAEAPGAQTLAQPEFSLFAGWGALRIEGIAATGVQARLAARPSPGGLLFSFSFFSGETVPGLAFQSGSFGFEFWSDRRREPGTSGPPLGARVGFGPAASWVAYRRATTSEWESALTIGLRAGFEVRVVRVRRSAVMLGAHAAVNLDGSIGGAVSLGFRFGGA